MSRFRRQNQDKKTRDLSLDCGPFRRSPSRWGGNTGKGGKSIVGPLWGLVEQIGFRKFHPKNT